MKKAFKGVEGETVYAIPLHLYLEVPNLLSYAVSSGHELGFPNPYIFTSLCRMHLVDART